MANLWSGRFSDEPDPQAFEFGASFSFDRRLFEDDVTGSLAYVDGLVRAGVFSAKEAESVKTALGQIRDKGLAEDSFVNGPDEDVHAFVERQLVERVGDLGKRLHTGRSRNEQVSLDLRLYLRRRIPLLQKQLGAVITALAGRARAGGTALMPAYTHLRRAQPVLVAHFFLAHVAAEEESRSARARSRQDGPNDRASHRLARHAERAAEWIQQGSAGRQARGVRCRRHSCGRARSTGRRDRRPGNSPDGKRGRGNGAVAGDRCRRLSGRQGNGVPAGSRSGGRHGARARGGRPRFHLAVACGVAAVQRLVR